MYVYTKYRNIMQQQNITQNSIRQTMVSSDSRERNINLHIYHQISFAFLISSRANIHNNACKSISRSLPFFRAQQDFA